MDTKNKKWPPKFGTGFLLHTWIALFFIIATVFLVKYAEKIEKDHAVMHAEEKAKIILDRNLATHAYFSKVLKPEVFELSDPYRSPEYFEPSWMSSTYAVREIDRSFISMGDNEYYYKESAINARNPENEADELEKQFIQELNTNPDLEFRSIVRKLGDEYFLVTLRRGETLEEECLRCHSTPERAPKGLVDKYGPQKSFNRKKGEVIDAISIRIPLSEAYAQAEKTSRDLVQMLISTFFILFAGQHLIYRYIIGRPLKVLFDHTLLLSKDDTHLGQEIQLQATKEFNKLSSTFNLMSKRLRNQIDTLEETITKRTTKLKTTNEQLQNEIKARRQTEGFLRKARKKAEASNQAKSQFLANMSHELRTPLNAIIGFANLLDQDPEISKKYKKEVGAICRSGEHLLGLINEVLDISRIEAGKLSLAPVNMNLSLFLQGIAEFFEIKARDKGLHFTMKIDNNVPQHIAVDEGKLRQILINLLGNSVKFTDQGSIMLRVKRKTGTHNTIYFEVKDTGIGISQEFTKKIYDPFVQVNSDKNIAGGVGLGLTICSRLIRLMGGTLVLESEINSGTTFSVEIPVDIIEPGYSAAVSHPARIVSLAPNQPQYRILIVEDNEDNRLLLKKLLIKVGFEVREAVNGKKGVELYQKWQPHLIWMDMEMDVMDGFEATQTIKNLQNENQHCNPTVIIALTAHVFEEERLKILAAGCDDFVRKPFEERIIFETMAKHLGVKFLHAPQGAGLEKKPSSRFDKDLEINWNGLPQKLLGQLKSAVLDLDMGKTNQLIEQVKAIDNSAGSALQELVDQFMFEEIVAGINTTINEKGKNNA